MSSKSEKTFIIFLELPSSISQNIDRIRAAFSSNRLDYKAHITLKQAEDFVISEKLFADKTVELVKNYKPFDVSIKNLSANKSKLGWNIYLKVESIKVVNLVKYLSKIFEKYIDPNSPGAYDSTKWEQSDEFYAHISIKGTDKKEKIEKLYLGIEQMINELKFPKIIKCQRITVAKWENNKWTKIKSVELK